MTDDIVKRARELVAAANRAPFTASGDSKLAVAASRTDMALGRLITAAPALLIALADELEKARLELAEVVEVMGAIGRGDDTKVWPEDSTLGQAIARLVQHDEMLTEMVSERHEDIKRWALDVSQARQERDEAAEEAERQREEKRKAWDDLAKVSHKYAEVRTELLVTEQHVTELVNERDDVRAEVERLRALRGVIAQVEKERDEARADVERLQQEAAHDKAVLSDPLFYVGVVSDAVAEEYERSRAEVRQLREERERYLSDLDGVLADHDRAPETND